MNGWIYLITDGEAVKIGLTTASVEKRNSQHQTGNPRKIETIYQFWADDVHAVEAELHQQFADKRLSGEWFSLTDDEIDDIVELYPSGTAGPAYMPLSRRVRIWWSAILYILFRRE